MLNSQNNFTMIRKFVNFCPIQLTVLNLGREEVAKLERYNPAICGLPIALQIPHQKKICPAPIWRWVVWSSLDMSDDILDHEFWDQWGCSIVTKTLVEVSFLVFWKASSSACTTTIWCMKTVQRCQCEVWEELAIIVHKADKGSELLDICWHWCFQYGSSCWVAIPL